MHVPSIRVYVYYAEARFHSPDGVGQLTPGQHESTLN
jgi:hypothetical protein